MNYVDNEKLHQAFVEYYHKLQDARADGLPHPRASDFIGKSIMDICRNLGSSRNFRNYTYLDEMIDDAIIACTKGITSFDPQAPNANAFNYMTMCASRAMIQRIEREKKQNYTKHCNFRMQVIMASLDGGVIVDVSPNEYSDQVITDYERTKQRRKQRQLDKQKRRSKQ